MVKATEEDKRRCFNLPNNFLLIAEYLKWRSATTCQPEPFCVFCMAAMRSLIAKTNNVKESYAKLSHILSPWITLTLDLLIFNEVYYYNE